MDVRYINPFIAAVRNVFQTMMDIEVGIGKPYTKREQDGSADVSGIIGFSGDAAGCVVVSFPKPVALRAVSAFAGTEISEDHPDFADAVGELANMIAGNAKKDFEGVGISISLPSVVIGENHTIPRSNVCPRVVVPCKTSFGPFSVEVGIRLEKEAAVVAS